VINAARLPRDVVTIGGSTGGIEALLALFRNLPPDFPAAVAIVVHRPPLYESRLAEVLDRQSPVSVVEPSDGDPFVAGRVLLAPRDHHLMLEDGRVRLKREPHQHRFRPAIDPLFISAAAAHGSRVVGVLLSGGGSDGVRGLVAIKAAGGLSIVQEPSEARNPAMPASAIAHDDVDAVLPLAEMASALIALSAGRMLESLPR
jgi:two-component system, chemotaxis family, protein-glutamate methylesterase/glutaminase